MSRIANNPVGIPSGVEVFLNGRELSVKGSKGSLEMTIDNHVDIKHEDDVLMFSAANNGKRSGALAGTYRSLVNNMVVGVSEGYQKKLELQGVGYRAKASGKSVNLTVGYSHPINYQLPEGVSAETPSQTEIVISGADKQLVGQVAAEIRKFRPPEPYKGKGIRYTDEHVYRKEAKKK